MLVDWSDVVVFVFVGCLTRVFSLPDMGCYSGAFRMLMAHEMCYYLN